MIVYELYLLLIQLVKCNYFSEVGFWTTQTSRFEAATSSKSDSMLSGVENTTCELCGKVFAQSESLKKHKQAYCGKEAKFKCCYCQYRSIMKANLKRHMLIKHSNQPMPVDLFVRKQLNIFVVVSVQKITRNTMHVQKNKNLAY